MLSPKATMRVTDRRGDGGTTVTVKAARGAALKRVGDRARSRPSSRSEKAEPLMHYTRWAAAAAFPPVTDGLG
jgi:hypothetical protein